MSRRLTVKCILCCSSCYMCELACYACVKLLYDRIISLRGEIFDRKTNLTWPLLNKVTVSTEESERSYISVLGI